jgi:trehalose utilization protein
MKETKSLYKNVSHKTYCTFFKNKIRKVLCAATDNTFIDRTTLSSFSASPITNGLSDHNDNCMINSKNKKINNETFK